MDGLNETWHETLQATLEQRKAALLAHLTSEAGGIAMRTTFANDIEASPADNACARTLNELVAEAAEQKTAQLRLVKHALAKFANGSYGNCENCGEPIGMSRLNARPEARFCIACQTMMEKTGRAQ